MSLMAQEGVGMKFLGTMTLISATGLVVGIALHLCSFSDRETLLQEQYREQALIIQKLRERIKNPQTSTVCRQRLVECLDEEVERLEQLSHSIALRVNNSRRI